MKNTITTIIALLVLGFAGYYVMNNRTTTDVQEPRIEVINGEEVEIDYPLTESFSNAESNKEVLIAKESNNENNTTSYGRAKSSIATTVKKVFKPLTLGFYYLNNLGNDGFENCSISGINTKDSGENKKYTPENFTLTDVTVADDSAYLYVDAQNQPEDLCAQIIQFKEYRNEFFEAVHVIVQ